MPVILGFFGEDPVGLARRAKIDKAHISLRDIPHSEIRSIAVDGFGWLEGMLADFDEASLAGDGEISVCADARIDNFVQLRRLYGVQPDVGEDFVSPARLLLKLFRVLGAEAWSAIRGDFAIALWDGRDRTLHLVRDVAGSRPLYYSATSDEIAFSSELRAAVALSERRLSIDLEQATRSLSALGLRITEPSRTMFEGYHRVPPGTEVIWSAQGIRVKRFWDPDRIPIQNEMELSEAAEELHRRIWQAVGRRLEGLTAVGCHLSGGLDCSTIAAMVSKHPMRPSTHHNYSWTPRQHVASDATELRRIDALCSLHGLDVTYIELPTGELQTAVRNPLGFYGSPLYPSRDLLLERNVLERARGQSVTRILSGWGGDEAASHHGFGIELELLQKREWCALHETLSRGSPLGRRVYWRTLLNRLRAGVVPALSNALVRQRPATIASKDLCRRFPVYSSWQTDLRFATSVRQAQVAAYYSGHLQERIESWDCAGKMYGLRYAYPLLDQDVLEWVYSLPGRMFRVGGIGRRVYKQAVHSYWPSGLAFHAPKVETGVGSVLREGLAEKDSVAAAAAGAVEQLLSVDYRGAAQGLLESSSVEHCARKAVENMDFHVLVMLQRGVRVLATAEWTRSRL